MMRGLHLLVIGAVGAVQGAAAQSAALGQARSDATVGVTPIATAPAAASPVWEQPIAAQESGRLREIEAMAECIVRRRPGQAAALLATPISSAEQIRQMERLRVARGCPEGSVEVSPHVLRGAFAEGLLRGAHAAPDRRANAQPGGFEAFRAWHLRGLRAPDSDFDTLVQARFAADCVASRRLGDIRALMSLQAGSREERLAMTALTPDILACAAMPRALAQVDRPTMRAALAEAAFSASSTVR